MTRAELNRYRFNVARITPRTARDKRERQLKAERFNQLRREIQNDRKGRVK